MIKIGVYGSNGRMGQKTLDSIVSHEGCVLSYAYTRSKGGSFDVLCQSSDVVIDFSSPEGLMALLPFAVKHKTKLVVGTTGFSDEEFSILLEASKNIPILYAANMSFLVLVLEKTLSDVARLLGKNYDVEIVDSYHANKKDAPSGTALALGAAIAKARGLEFIPWSHQNGRRPDGAIGFSSIRGGNMSGGEHRIMFIGNHEYIEFAHRSQDRSIYADGAVRCAMWLYEKEHPKLYSMNDLDRPN